MPAVLGLQRLKQENPKVEANLVRLCLKRKKIKKEMNRRLKNGQKEVSEEGNRKVVV